MRNVRLQRSNGEIRNILPTILERIDISHDRFLSGNNGGRKHTASVKKSIQQNYPEGSIIQKFSEKNLN